VKYFWKITIDHPLKDNETIVIYGVAANMNIALQKAKKSVKEKLEIKSNNDDLFVTNAEKLHEVEF